MSIFRQLGLSRSRVELTLALLRFRPSFATHLSPLYPIIPRRLFLPIHFPALAADEPVLLAALVAVAARFAPSPLVPAQNQAVYEACATSVRQAVVHLLDGLPRFRTVGTVEALLVLSEWPLVPFQKGRVAEKGGQGEDVLGGLVAPVEQYDGFAWSYVGEHSGRLSAIFLPERSLTTLRNRRRNGCPPRAGVGDERD